MLHPSNVAVIHLRITIQHQFLILNSPTKRHVHLYWVLNYELPLLSYYSTWSGVHFLTSHRIARCSWTRYNLQKPHSLIYGILVKSGMSPTTGLAYCLLTIPLIQAKTVASPFMQSCSFIIPNVSKKSLISCTVLYSTVTTHYPYTGATCSFFITRSPHFQGPKCQWEGKKCPKVP